MTRRRHDHPCFYADHGCTNRVPCSGELERNDGFPEVICTSYHLPNGTIDAPVCDECADALCVQCDAVTRLTDHAEHCPQHPENIEPPDPWEDVAWPFAENH